MPRDVWYGCLSTPKREAHTMAHLMDPIISTVSLVKAHGRHAVCTTWATDGVPCVGHGPWCDRVVLIDPVGTRFFAAEGRGIPVPTDRTEYARHAA